MTLPENDFSLGEAELRGELARLRPVEVEMLTAEHTDRVWVNSDGDLWAWRSASGMWMVWTPSFWEASSFMNPEGYGPFTEGEEAMSAKQPEIEELRAALNAYQRDGRTGTLQSENVINAAIAVVRVYDEQVARVDEENRQRAQMLASLQTMQETADPGVYTQECIAG